MTYTAEQDHSGWTAGGGAGRCEEAVSVSGNDLGPGWSEEVGGKWSYPEYALK